MLSHSFTSSAILYNYYGLSYAHSPRELPVHPRPSLPSAVSFCFLMPPHNSSCVRPPWNVPSVGSITAACCSGTFQGARLGESSGVLVLADLGGCSFRRILKGARAGGFEGRWLWRILWGQKKWCLFCADLGSCSFWRCSLRRMFRGALLLNGRYDFLVKRIPGACFVHNLGWSFWRISMVAHFCVSKACQGRASSSRSIFSRALFGRALATFVWAAIWGCSL